jgi:hypothetical protein
VAIGALAATILEYAAVGFSTNHELVKSLKSGNETLEHIARSFTPRSAMLNTISFFELESMFATSSPVIESGSKYKEKF